MRRFRNWVWILALAWLCGGIGRAQLFVAYRNAGVVSKYDAETGALQSERFILGLNRPVDMSMAEGALYILQEGSNSVGKYDPATGAAIQAQFITDIDYPLAMAVDGSLLFVACGDAENRTVRIHKYDAASGALVKADFVRDLTPPIAIAVSKGHLFIGTQMNGVREYDATTGEVIKNQVPFGAPEADHLAFAGDYLLIGTGSDGYGYIFRVNPDLPPEPQGLAFLNTLVSNAKDAAWMAWSGDDLFVGGLQDTSIARYNANDGKRIKADFIPALGDRLGGLAVVPRAPSGAFSLEDTELNLRKLYWKYSILSSTWGGGYYFGAAVLFGVVVVAWILWVLFRRPHRVPAPALEEPPVPIPAPDETVPATAALAESESPKPAPAESPAAYGTSALLKIGTAIMVITLIPVAIIGEFGYQAWQMNAHLSADAADQKNLIGVWSYRNDLTREPEEPWADWDLMIYPKKIEFSQGSGEQTVEGEWRPDGFWYQKADGSGEAQAVKVLDAENVQFQMSAIDPSNQQVVTLYKEHGSEAEAHEIAEKYPGPVTYPPPAGVIHLGMTEYELKSLPWKVDSYEIVGERYSRGYDCFYHSDNPRVDPLHVIIKNHRVMEMRGGNG